LHFDALPTVDVCWCSHGHTIISTSRRCRTRRQILATRDHPLGKRRYHAHADSAIHAEAFDWHHRIELGGGIAVTLVPTRHWSARGLFDRNSAVGEFRAWKRGRKNLRGLRFRLWQRQTFHSVAEAHGPLVWRFCRSAPMSRAGSCGPAHEPSDAVKALADCGAHRRWRIITAHFS